MKSSVQKAAEYDESLETPQTFTCTGTVTWGSVSNNNIRLVISIDGKERSITHTQCKDYVQRPLESFDFEKRPKDEDVKILIRGITERNNGITHSNGKEYHRWEGKKLIEELSTGVTIDIGYGSKVYLKLSGYPQKPEIPEWGK